MVITFIRDWNRNYSELKLPEGLKGLGLHGNHRISALWFNPLGKQQDQIDFEFSTDQPKIENWVSLKFRDASDQTNPFLSDFFSPQLNGQWQVKVFLDGNFLDTLRFEVRCG